MERKANVRHPLASVDVNEKGAEPFKFPNKPSSNEAWFGGDGQSVVLVGALVKFGLNSVGPFLTYITSCIPAVLNELKVTCIQFPATLGQKTLYGALFGE